MKNEESKEINNQPEIIEPLNRTQNIFNIKDENQKLKELENKIEKLSLNLKDEDNSPGKLSNIEENQRKNCSQKQTPIIYNITEDDGMKEMNKINLQIQSRERGRAKTNFPQKEIKHTPSYNNQKSSGSNPSPLYSYYDEYSKYLSKYIHLDEENNQKENFQFSSSKNVNPNRKAMINAINSITSPKGDSTNETPNYNDFNFFSNNNKSPDPNEVNNNNININFNNINGNINNNQFKVKTNLNINYDPNMFNNNFNFQNLGNEMKIQNLNNLNNGIEQNENQFNQFPNFSQIPFNSFPSSYQNQMYFQNNMMFNKDNSNNMIQQQQTPITKLDPEDFIFEKFGKRGWQCEKCNNFNFETRVKCNRCGIDMMPKLINKNRRDDNNNLEEKKKKPLIERKGDWLCPKCRNLNFAFRLICNRCQLAKSEAENMLSFQQNMSMNGNLIGRGFRFNQQNSQNNNNQGFNFNDYQNMNIYNNYYGIPGNNMNNVKNNILNQNMMNYLNMKPNQRQMTNQMNQLNQMNFTNFAQQMQNNNMNNMNNMSNMNNISNINNMSNMNKNINNMNKNMSNMNNIGNMNNMSNMNNIGNMNNMSNMQNDEKINQNFEYQMNMNKNNNQRDDNSSDEFGNDY